ncbi:putative NADH dehydrogenase [Corchorus olitorius]|uniref:NADH dehydrogenase n=1 Tax=Corchorus olitorius TaxID=93759 RepID=A0A1R3IXH4_9ROSI|nr:putative NADH dehydrogenase [Corchorus olitorius]
MGICAGFMPPNLDSAALSYDYWDSNRVELWCHMVIDLLLFKAMEELNNITEHAKQRHHVIGQYVLGRQGLVQDLDAKDDGASDFLKNFYKSNYF